MGMNGDEEGRGKGGERVEGEGFCFFEIIYFGLE